MALNNVETVLFYAVLSVAFLISYTLDVTNLDIRFRRINELVQLAIELGAICVFFASPNNSQLLGVFATYIAMAIYINLVIDTFQKRRMSIDRLTFATIHSVLVVLTTALAFGATQFGQVPSKLGGGRQQEALITLTDSAKNLLPESIPVDKQGSVKGTLVYQTDNICSLAFQMKPYVFDLMILHLFPLNQRSKLRICKRYRTFSANPITPR